MKIVHDGERTVCKLYGYRFGSAETNLWARLSYVHNSHGDRSSSVWTSEWMNEWWKTCDRGIFESSTATEYNFTCTGRSTSSLVSSRVDTSLMYSTSVLFSCRTPPNSTKLLPNILHDERLCYNSFGCFQLISLALLSFWQFYSILHTFGKTAKRSAPTPSRTSHTVFETTSHAPKLISYTSDVCLVPRTACLPLHLATLTLTLSAL